MFDIAMLKIICFLADSCPDNYRRIFHCEPSMALRFWNSFVKQYFGSEFDVARVDEMVEPYLMIRILSMETETGRNYVDNSSSNFGPLCAKFLL